MERDDDTDQTSQAWSGQTNRFAGQWDECKWQNMPLLVLEKIYSHLSLRERYHCSQVCLSWYETFYSPPLWRRLTFDETTFSYQRPSVFGYEMSLSQEKVKKYLGVLGRHVKYIIIPETFEFHQLHNFLIVLVAYLEFFQDYPMPLLQSLHFTFACESRVPVVGPIVLGTGGKLLEIIIQLLKNTKNMKILVLNNLLLEYNDAPRVLEKVVDSGCMSLSYVEMLNFTKERCPLYQLGSLKGMSKLVITPSQLTDDVVVMVAAQTQTEELVICQNKYSGEPDPVSPEAWTKVKKLKPGLRVHLDMRGNIKTELLIQSKAPVWCILQSTPYDRMSTPKALSVLDNYSKTLKVYGHLALPRRHGSRSFHHRGDSGFVLLVRECFSLETLIIQERISTATLLILAYEGSQKSLRHLYVRRNAAILRSDWPKPLYWDRERFRWLQKVSQSYDLIEEEISALFGTKWCMLSDSEFKRLEAKYKY